MGNCLYLGRDEEGKKRYQWHTIKGTKQAAEREMVRLINELNTGRHVDPPPKLTIKEFLERWLQDRARITTSEKTFERYREIVRNHLVPQLGTIALNKLKPWHIQSYLSNALETGRLNGKGGLSKQTVLHHYRLLHTALGQACAWGLLACTPAEGVKPPRPDHQETQVLDEREVSVLLKALKGTSLYLPVFLAMTTGMRRGEICALRWHDVDLGSGIIMVQQSLQQTKRGLAFKAPKTARSRRKIKLLQITVEALLQHKVEQDSQHARHGLVCTRPDGRPWNPNTLSQGFGNCVKKLPIPRIRFHDCRHTHATLLLLEGIHPKIVSERLGHSTVGITLDLYSHLLPQMQEEAAAKLNARLMQAAAEEN